MLKLAILVAGSLGFLVSYVHGDEGSPSVLSATNTTFQMHSNESTNRLKAEQDRAAALDAALAYAAKQHDDIIRGAPLPPSRFPFPNAYGEPLHPSPDYVNFYVMYDHFPDYLLCQYDVSVKNYNQSNEPKWFKSSLEQTRRLGPEKFPPIKWVAVIICNETEWKDANTIDQAHKVGAIFKACDVFDSACDLSQLIVHADMDRHPLFFDPERPKLFPDEQHRWMIVERHAATNSTATGPDSSK
jgi:hypothetical protein